MRITAALAAVVLFGALGLWLLLPGQVHVGRAGPTDGASPGTDPVPASPAGAVPVASSPSDVADLAPEASGGPETLAETAPGVGDDVLADRPTLAPMGDGPGPGPAGAGPAESGSDPGSAPEAPLPAQPPAGVAPTAPAPDLAADLAALELPDLDLLIPVAGIGAGDLVDTFADARSGGRSHDAIDIMAAAGTPVLAVADGRIAKLFESEYGGLTVYQFDATGALAYYYAHLDSYAAGLKEGDAVRRGEPIGSVGFSGNAHPDAPHLHFAVFVLGPERNWWQGTAINPYPYLAEGR